MIVGYVIVKSVCLKHIIVEILSLHMCQVDYTAYNDFNVKPAMARADQRLIQSTETQLNGKLTKIVVCHFSFNCVWVSIMNLHVQLYLYRLSHTDVEDNIAIDDI